LLIKIKNHRESNTTTINSTPSSYSPTKYTMVFISIALKKIHNAQYNTTVKKLQKDVGEDGVNIITMIDCDFYTNKKMALTGRPGIVSSTKNLAIAPMG
jgi:hypothetical protein